MNFFYRVATVTSASAAASVPIGVCVAATSWAEASVKITRMTLTIKLGRNWSSFQLASSAPPLSVTGSAISLSARIPRDALFLGPKYVSEYTLPLLYTSCCRAADVTKARFPTDAHLYRPAKALGGERSATHTQIHPARSWPTAASAILPGFEPGMTGVLSEMDRNQRLHH